MTSSTQIYLIDRRQCTHTYKISNLNWFLTCGISFPYFSRKQYGRFSLREKKIHLQAEILNLQETANPLT